MVKQVIIMRKDLNMRKGKMVAQGGHAVMYLMLKVGEHQSLFDQWKEAMFTKICVSVDTEGELVKLYHDAMEANLLTTIVQDKGKTEFKEPTLTCCAILGDSEEVNKLTGELKLL